jgi:hypothetical protein
MTNYSLDIHLTIEQARLYQTSGVFRHGVDQLLNGFIPTFLEGLALRAETQDAEIEARKQAMESEPVTIVAVHPYEEGGFMAGLLRGYEEGRRG